MEDEQANVVGQCSNVGVLESTLVETFDGEDRVEENGEEVMVQVVGSDVFVDGVSSHNEGEFEAGEVGVSEGRVWEDGEQPVRISNPMKSIEDGDVDYSVSVDVEDGAVCPLPSHDEVGNSGTDATAVSSSVEMVFLTVENKKVAKSAHVVVSVEEAIKDEFVVDDENELLVDGSRKDGSFGCNAERGSSDSTCGVDAKCIDGKEVASACNHSIIRSDTQVCEVENENQGCVDEFHEIKVELNCGNYGVLQSNVQSADEKSVFIGTVEAVVVKSAETHKLCFLNGPTSFVDREDTTETNENEGLATRADTEKNQQSVTNSCNPGDDEFGPADLDMCENQHVVAMPACEVIYNQNVLISCENIVNGDGMSKQCRNAETADAMAIDEHAVCNVPYVDSQAWIDHVPEENHTFQSNGQSIYVPIPEISHCKVERLESIDLMPIGVTGITQPGIFPGITEKAELLQCNNDAGDGSRKTYEHSVRRSVVVSAKLFSVDEMLLQLQLVAEDPKKGHEFYYNLRSFFEDFRSSIALTDKEKDDLAMNGSCEYFKSDGVNSSHLLDKIVHDYSAVQLLNDCKKEVQNLPPVRLVTADEYVIPYRKSRKRYSNGNYPMTAMEVEENVKRRKHESLPAELILNFAERKCLPSEINLNKMFRRFGPLMESETQVDYDLGRAKVIFKRGSDAEVALNSSKRFNIFGPVLVNYQIDYSPLISVKISPPALPQDTTTLLL